MNEFPEITADPKVMTGMPCIRNTRVTVANLVRQIAAGRTPDEICHDYPNITAASIQAALAFAAAVTSTESYDLIAS
ncbi:MAG: DUF433 domain-containing protein [Akkermansiaceae bacterium]